MTNILETLIYASEKAARIARSCCNSSESILVAEKGDTEANPRFDKDFKTIADVLAQESAKEFIVSRIPELKGEVRGEECSEIGGISIALQENSEETINLLSKILPIDTAKCMAKAAHSDVEQLNYGETLPDIPNIDYSDLGVWIDPIDGTAEFISGVRGEAKPGHGLPCVTVLIGAYLKSTGQPVVGVINQPFYDNGEGRIVWGVKYGDTQLSSHESTSNDNKVILMSSAENEEVIEKFKNIGWEVQSMSGAGHKLLKVALGEASAYIVSKGTTFRWDTCAPHSIICAKGGDVVCYKNHTQLKYNNPQNMDIQEYCNQFGIIAFTDSSVFEEIKDVIKIDN
ncbi:inositol polyphosphate 1-phosphatase [Colias croceus]|uniref:inositol polyphosphate 1-phosphatase n=1 Tax=Colias crocea TaxID=72248 RepID=UPI001E2812F4|nr:inositol polyphosphate 1-phosphatase [Colias croceus]